MNFDYKDINMCYYFAKNMVGKHNPDLIGKRNPMEIFRDDIRGKLGEIAVRDYIKNNMKNAVVNEDIDFSVSERGIWDKQDLIVNNKYLSIKSIKPQSQLLMIESKRYDNNGKYVYKNNDGSDVKIDLYVLVRVGIEPEIGWDDFKSEDIYKFLNPFGGRYENGKWVKSAKVKRRFYAEVLGGIKHDDFWKCKKYIKKGIKLNLKNINSIFNGCDIDKLPDKVMEWDKKNNILQEDNFIIHRNQLKALEELDI